MATKVRYGTLAMALAAALAGTSPALAHHMMDGKVPVTFVQGLMSGLAHPVIGPDHLAFLAAIGIAAAIVPAGARLILAFIAASTAGVLAHAGALDVPFAEALVASSVVVAGALVTTGRGAGAGLWLAVAVLAGVVHGYAFGESIVGADRPVLGAYLLGLALVSAAVAAGFMAVTRAYVATAAHPEGRLRVAGALVGCIGLVMLV
ncbi:MAG: HupE/UreJ family protein, partial [Hyphomicrobiaceae bacterium]